MAKKRKAKPDFRFELQVSDKIHKSKAKVTAFESWINEHPEFVDQRPDTQDFIDEALRRGSAMYKAGVLETRTAKAARLHWESEANYYLRHVQTVRVNVRTEVVSPPTKTYVQVRTVSSGTAPPEYFDTAKKLYEDPDRRTHVLDSAMVELKEWFQRYEDSAGFYETFGELLDVYRDVRVKVNRRIKKISSTQ
jgi:hypothetical protein